MKRVSIPFKRESLSKGDPLKTGARQNGMFPFPSNGKVYPKKSFLNNTEMNSVSIPFKRESLSKDYGTSAKSAYYRKVSIPFKRESLSKDSEGEFGPHQAITVSIPFKRESLSKERDRNYRHAKDGRFHSLQTGKSIQSEMRINAQGTKPCFHSLQTGKSIQSRLMMILGEQPLSLSFHSLQTGKSIQSVVRESSHSSMAVVSIPFKRESLSKVGRNSC